MAQAGIKEWERGIELEPRTLGKGIQARMGHGFDIEPTPMERFQERLECGFDLESRTLEERTARDPEKLGHGFVIEPWSQRRTCVGSGIKDKTKKPMVRKEETAEERGKSVRIFAIAVVFIIGAAEVSMAEMG
jgi:hypothetical protein